MAYYRAVRPGMRGGALFLGDPQKDGYLEKLTKYVPVEGLAPFVVIASGASDTRVVITLVASFVFALLVVIGATSAAVSEKDGEWPRLWFWLFFLASYFAWAVGTSEEFREILGWDASGGAWLLGLTAVLIPAIDTALEQIWPKKH